MQHSARALTLITCVLLLFGYAALRILTGASDAPRVDVSGAADEKSTVGAQDAIETDTVHKLRPQTSPAVPAIGTLREGQSPLTPGSAWNAPADDWDAAPAAHFTDELEIASEPDVVR